MGGTFNKTDRESQIKWTENMDAFLLDVLLHQHVIGNRVNGQWTTTSYDFMVNELSEKLDKPLKEDHLMNRLKTLKKNFNEAHDMFKNSSGFGWNSETRFFLAEPEVWKDLIQAKPGAEKFVTTPIPFYDKLNELFAKDRANGEATKTPKERARERSVINSIDDIDEMVSQNKKSLQNYGASEGATNDEVSPIDPHQHKIREKDKKSVKVENSSKGKKRKAGSDDDQEVTILKQGLDSVAEAIREGNSVLRQIRPRVHSSDELFEEIMKIGVEESKQFKAYRFLNAKCKRVAEFFGCPSHLRRAFLDEMMEEEGL